MMYFLLPVPGYGHGRFRQPLAVTEAMWTRPKSSLHRDLAAGHTGGRVRDVSAAALFTRGVGPVFPFAAFSFVEESLLNDRNTGTGSFDFDISVLRGEKIEGEVCIKVSAVELNGMSFL